MDQYFAECHQELLLSIPEFGKNVVTTDKPQSEINFQFCCKPIYKFWVITQDHAEPQLVKEVETVPLINDSVRVNLSHLMSSSNETSRLINGKLRNWPVQDCKRQNFINQALNYARDLINSVPRDLINSMPREHHVSEFTFHVIVYHNHVFDENRAINSRIQLSMEESDSFMVPAMESSIERLEMKTIASGDENQGSCCICLEDLLAGCEGIAMPCSHIFHGDCIKKWLKTSHYCPVCRFEMPTN